MVRLHVKKGDESLFLHDTTCEAEVADLIKQLVIIQNGRLKVQRLCAEIEDLAAHGITLPPNMQGLTDEQVIELKLVDEWAEKCTPSGGYTECVDKIGRRNGRAPTESLAAVLKKTCGEAKEVINKKKVESNTLLLLDDVKEALNILRGAVTIVYPMGLPPHEPIHLEFINEEQLDGMQAALEVLDPDDTSMWWAGKEVQCGKTLGDFIGKNEKTKVVVKLTKKGGGAPGREPVMGETQQKEMMMHYYRKQEERKKLDAAEDDNYLDSKWADSNSLKRQFQGLNDVSWSSGFKLK